MKITCFELPDDPALYLAPGPQDLPPGWDALPADSPSMAYGTRWLQARSHLGLVVPSVVLQLERNLVVNPCTWPRRTSGCARCSISPMTSGCSRYANSEEAYMGNCRSCSTSFMTKVELSRCTLGMLVSCSSYSF